MCVYVCVVRGTKMEELLKQTLWHYCPSQEHMYRQTNNHSHLLYRQFSTFYSQVEPMLWDLASLSPGIICPHISPSSHKYDCCVLILLRVGSLASVFSPQPSAQWAVSSGKEGSPQSSSVKADKNQSLHLGWPPRFPDSPMRSLLLQGAPKQS